MDVMQEIYKDDQPRCELCQHFRADDYTGYCLIYHMFVLKTFACGKFIYRHLIIEQEESV